MLQGQGWVIVTETVWSAKPKTFTIWPFTEEVCWLLSELPGHTSRISEQNPSNHLYPQTEGREFSHGATSSLAAVATAWGLGWALLALGCVPFTSQNKRLFWQFVWSFLDSRLVYLVGKNTILALIYLFFNKYSLGTCSLPAAVML